VTGLSHAMISWTIAQGAGTELRDRRLVTWLGIVPDADAIVYVVGAIPNLSLDEGFMLYASMHHHHTHGAAMLLAGSAVAAVLGRNRAGTVLLAGVAIVVHLLCDVIGSGSGFPIYPFWPFDEWLAGISIAWTVPWSVPVREWPNLVAGFVLLVGAFAYGYRIGRTPLEAISLRMDRELMRHLRARLGWSRT